jgi:hypothetical protein
MPFSDRLDLRAAVRNHLSLTTEITDSVVDDWIRLCEADLNRRLRVLDRQETANLTIAGETVEVPYGFRAPVDLYLATTPRLRVRIASEEAVRVMQGVRGTGPPRLFAVLGDSDLGEGKALVFGPLPDQSYSGKLTYWRAFSTGPGSTADDMLTRWPDAWLYGSLVHAHSYLGNEPQVPVVEEKYLEAVAGIIAEDDEARYGRPAA